MDLDSFTCIRTKSQWGELESFPMESIDPGGVAKFDPRGIHEWHSLLNGPLAIATYQISKL